jgi:hypothetical protein
MTQLDPFSAYTTSRDNFLAVIDGLTDGELVAPGVEGKWSIKDILAHLTAWEAEMVKLLAQARSSKRPHYLSLNSGLPVDVENEQWYQESKDRPLDRILGDFHGVRKHLIRQLSNYTEKELNNPDLFKWLEGKPLLQYIADEALTHETEHAAAIKQWRDSRK